MASTSSAFPYEQPHQELVKCVVVGDTAVGKTRLICARACDARLTLSQLMTTHIPTVWAIDQYRIYKEVLDRSQEDVDDVSVSLRLWDTFGDHDKDRQFAYGRSDVVLLCFSIANPRSLRNCKVMWFPEIRRFCPNTPVVLVGCKNDLRFMYRDEQFLSLCRDRSPFFRPLRECDILGPEQGRGLAKELGIPYFETSVLTHYGVQEVFENVIRAALVARRQQRFWMTNLKHVRTPQLQKPFCPPKPPPPEISLPLCVFEEDLSLLFANQSYTDVILVSNRTGFPAHRAILSAASTAFLKLFAANLHEASSNSWCTADTSSLGNRSASDSSVVSSLEASSGCFGADTDPLILGGSGGHSKGDSGGNKKHRASFRLGVKCHAGGSNGGNSGHNNHRHPSPMRRRASCQIYPESPRPAALTSSHHNSQTPVTTSLHHPAFQSISATEGGCTTVVVMSNRISTGALQECIRFIYTGLIDVSSGVSLEEVITAAELLQLKEVAEYSTNIEGGDKFQNVELFRKYQERLRIGIRDICLDRELFADVIFQVEDGQCPAHRCILVSRCEMMAAMFRGDFRESSAKVVHFPGIHRECFRQLLVYIYTGVVCDSVGITNCMPLLELANRLCLARLVALVEMKIADELSRSAEKGVDITETVLEMLEPAQIHNADQLADFCLYQISISYNDICRKNLKLLRQLHPENQAYLNRNRWPPVWYLKERDYYERCMRERLWSEKPPKRQRRTSGSTSGCLCFSSSSSAKRLESDDSLAAYNTV